MTAQEQDIEKLKEALGERKLTLIIGTGVSINATTTIDDKGQKQIQQNLTWPGLILSGVDFLVENRIVDNFTAREKKQCEENGQALRDCLSQTITLETDELLDIAGFVKQKLRKYNSYMNWQAGVFRKLYATINHEPNDILDAIGSLHDFGAKLMTTNYDDLLEHHYGMDSIGPRDKEDIQTFFNGSYTRGVLHVHGMWRKPRDTVLDLVDYSAIQNNSTIQQSLKGMFGGTEVVLFVGTSGGMDDPNFGALLEWASKEFEDIENRHYMLVREHETAVRPYVKSIFYGKEFDDLPRFLRRLVPRVSKASNNALRKSATSGVLAHVNMGAISLTTATQLATGADGWAKANERSEALIQLLSSRDGQLVSTSSFNAEQYRHARQEFNAMQGVLVENGVMTTVNMPKASTAVTKDPGITCLKALTSCLLCLCTQEMTTLLLQRLIPFKLIQHDYDDGSLDLEGSLVTGLRQWVSTVAVEEKSNKFQDYLFQCVDEHLARLADPQVVSAFDEIRRATHHFHSGDEPLILGVLKWILIPKLDRSTSKYPTRSLRVLTAAVIMERMGFEVSPADWIASNQMEYSENMQLDPDDENASEVFLVTHNIQGKTDIMTEFVLGPPESPLPRATPLLNIPVYAFEHVKDFNNPIKEEYLRGAYKGAFTSASKAFKSVQVENFQVQLEIERYELDDPFSDRYKALFSPFSPHLHGVCIEPMQHFKPGDWDEWEFSDHEAIFRIIRNDSHSATLRNFYTTMAIVLGSLYGLCSQACFTRGKPLLETSEIAFNPDLLYQDDCKYLRKWARIVGRALEGTITLSEWESVIFEMFVGAAGIPIDDPASTGQGESAPRSHVLGVQSHGFTAVSDVIVALKIRPGALGYFHIGRGQLLTLPLDKNGLIRTSEYRPIKAKIRVGSSEQEMRSLYRSSHETPEAGVRLDVEPCWEGDEQAVILRWRRSGLAIASLNISLVLQRLSRNIVPCSCGGFSNEVTPLQSENWYHLRIADLSSYAIEDNRPGKLADLKKADLNFLIDASQSEEVLIYVLGIVDANRVIIAKECLNCAYQYHTKKKKASSPRSVIVIPHDNRLTADTKEQEMQRAAAVETRLKEAEEKKRAFSFRLRGEPSH